MGTWKDIKRSILLASQSPRRHELLRLMGMPFNIEVSPVEDESLYFKEFSLETGLKNLAIAKASTVSKENPEHLVIGADTVVVNGNAVLGKPKNREEAFATLQSLSGKTHVVKTGVAFLCSVIDYIHCEIATTEVTFRTLEDWEIDAYLDLKTFSDKAGSYAIQDQGALLIDKISGCYNNVVGFPTSLLITMFNRFSQIDG